LIDYLDVIKTPHKNVKDIEQNRRDFKQFYAQYDVRRGKSFRDTFPQEFVDFYDSIQTEWTINFGLDTNLIVEPFSFTFPPYTFTQDGCYRFNVVFTCVTGGTITLTSTWYVSTVGIKELTGNSKQLIGVVDLMGRDTKIQPNKLLIYTYSDGSKEIRYINE
jgi:hypothetical protein